MNYHDAGDRTHLSRDESIAPGELGELLHRLQGSELPFDPPDDNATVAAVCELSGVSAHRVWEVLDQIREEDLESRIAEKLRELEEPLYRVERPGFSRDPLSSVSPFGRRKAFDSVLDRLPRRQHVAPAKKAEQPTHHDTASRWVATLVLVLFLLLFAAVIAQGISQHIGR